MLERAKNYELFASDLTEEQKYNTELNKKEDSLNLQVMKSFPRRIVAELTNNCNISCIMCGRTGESFKTTDFELDWFKKIEESFQYSEEIVLHGWGEPTVHPQFSAILEYLDQFPLRKYFVTNGMNLDQYFNDIFEHHVDILAISLDGATADTNNKIRVGSDFNQIVESLVKIVNYKKERNLDYPYLNFVFTGMQENIDELPQMVELASRIGLDEVKMVYLTVFNQDMINQSLYSDQEHVEKVFDFSIKKARAKNILLKIPFIQGHDPAKKLNHRECHFLYRDLFIGSDGYIRPCVSHEKRLFNIDDMNSFKEIWNHQCIQLYRKIVNNPNKEDIYCQKCYHSSCANWNNEASFLQLENRLPNWGEFNT